MKKCIAFLLSVLIALMSFLPLMASAESSISLNKNKLTFYMIKGEKTPAQSLKATVDGAKKSSLTWSSSDTAIAKVNKDGKVTPVAAGECVITCAHKDGVTATCRVVVKKAAVTKVKLNKSKLTLKMTDSKAHPTATLKVKVSPSKAYNPSVKWTSSDPSVATVNSKGVVKAKGKGTAIITCTSKANPEVSAICKVTVKDNRTPTLKADRTHIKLEVGETKTVTVTFNKKGTVYWNTEDDDIVTPAWTYKWTGNKTKLKITGKARGTAYVRITNDVDDTELIIQVDVISKEPTVDGWTLSDFGSVSDPFGSVIENVGYALDYLSSYSTNYTAASYMWKAYQYAQQAAQAAAALPAIYNNNGESLTQLFNELLDSFELWDGSTSYYVLLSTIIEADDKCEIILSLLKDFLERFPH